MQILILKGHCGFVRYISGIIQSGLHSLSYSRKIATPFDSRYHKVVMVTHFGSLATINREPRQARKGATVAVISCAVV